MPPILPPMKKPVMRGGLMPGHGDNRPQNHRNSVVAISSVRRVLYSGLRMYALHLLRLF
jgi:hypothetical protein